MKETIESWTKASDIQYTAEGQQIRDAAKEAEEYLTAQLDRGFRTLDYWKSLQP